ncbi:MAG TPA: FtsX-like permease family protein [Rhizomicrobium sp.]|jgi:putative ABC transport system permease protein|nr:FtsX-like permease family protein [Rhizomicrobium sp.]
MNLLRQIWIVSIINFKSLPHRIWQSLVIVVGMGCVVGVLLSMLSMTEGMHRAYLNTGDPGRALVVSEGSESENNSAIPRDQARIIMDAPGIAKAADGSPLADPGINAGIPVLRLNGAKAYDTLRGFGPKGVKLRPEFHMVAGRMFSPGTRELIVGAAAHTQYQGMNIGDKVILPDGEWPIVGSFATGDLLDGQLIGDTETVMLAVRRKAYNSVLVRLQSYDSLTTFKKALTTNPALSVSVERQSDWYKKISEGFSTFFSIIAYGVGVIMAMGALFGCLNTMYAAVSTRGREIATLRALGYGAFPVAVSVILEAMLLSVTGALIGAAIAWSLYDGVQDGFGNNVFKLTVSPALIGMAVLWAVVVALLGGLLPSIRAARRPVVDALRAT